MSIATKTGDGGTTALMYDRRVSKCDPRVEALGSVDELNSALGMARATATVALVRETVEAVQQDLILLMGELATTPEDWERYCRGGYALIQPAATARLERLIAHLESQNLALSGWARPGESVNSAALEVARTTARRAERRVCVLRELGQLRNAEVMHYLNRLSDALWLLARWVEAQEKPGQPGGTTEV